MTIPALSRTYYSEVDYVLDNTTGALAAKNMLWLIKAVMKKEALNSNSAGAGSWTCAGSSDAVTAGMDAVDRWGSTYDQTKIVRASGAVAHSWIVLTNATFGCWLTFDYSSSTDGQGQIYITTTAPTGGTITARPTSGVERNVGNSFAIADTNKRYAHCVRTSDGHFLMFSGIVGSRIVSQMLSVWEMLDVKSGDTKAWTFINDEPNASGVLKSTNSAGNKWRSSISNPWHVARNAANSAWLAVYPGFWATSGNSGTCFFGTTLTATDAANGQFLHTTLFCVSGVTGATATVKGRYADWHQTVTYRDGSQYPVNSATQTHISIGNVFVPFSLVPRL